MAGLLADSPHYHETIRGSGHKDAYLILLHGFDITYTKHLISIGVHMGDNDGGNDMGKNIFNGSIHSVNNYPAGDEPAILIYYNLNIINLFLN